MAWGALPRGKGGVKNRQQQTIVPAAVRVMATGAALALHWDAAMGRPHRFTVELVAVGAEFFRRHPEQTGEGRPMGIMAGGGAAFEGRRMRLAFHPIGGDGGMTADAGFGFRPDQMTTAAVTRVAGQAFAPAIGAMEADGGFRRLPPAGMAVVAYLGNRFDQQVGGVAVVRQMAGGAVPLPVGGMLCVFVKGMACLAQLRALRLEEPIVAVAVGCVATVALPLGVRLMGTESADDLSGERVAGAADPPGVVPHQPRVAGMGAMTEKAVAAGVGGVVATTIFFLVTSGAELGHLLPEKGLAAGVAEMTGEAIASC